MNISPSGVKTYPMLCYNRVNVCCEVPGTLPALAAVCEIVDYHARSSADYFQDIFVANVTYITLQSTLP